MGLCLIQEKKNVTCIAKGTRLQGYKKSNHVLAEGIWTVLGGEQQHAARKRGGI